MSVSAVLSPKVRLEHVDKSFGDVHALSDVSLTLGDREFVSVVGASGCGKSTLLSIIAGLEAATSGEASIQDVPISGPGRDRGVVFQSATLLPWLTAIDNVVFALRGERGMGRRERFDRARDVLSQVGLSGFEDAYPAQLSGGMQQRVALARSLAYGPEVLLMDEPFGALDALTRRTMQELLTTVWERNRMTVMLITHDIEEAVFLSDRVVAMTPRPGRVRAEFDIELPRPRTPDVIGSPEFHRYYTDILGLIHHG
ncbi:MULTISPECIES: ABC transporter ATP-binding protein [Microbacterium]|jgi:NitT/TauT family transport system ATP-binding protein|uniref:ABC transporter ATP-binding protein n=1 Tax=Microbacterium TaxID=33882 RepID=UPI0023D9CD06|nr:MULTISPECIES: ABC transporter ATP-binding protein [Microbacterium]MDF2045679.1 ABC transporter ATP-binding protein [Microbacterium sp. Kw_RZR3]MDF2916312.1 ntrC [Microbacterium sp.]MDQ1074920.1 NitT/TauT family transport system ATP-binding protein [Microbacterium sp. SORGH_AS_0969]MDQ1115145.1 NitT/TauT family transport system ATP-binding protein [Microbacterium testaceum]